VQLNLQKLPKKLENKFGSGLLQLFYCTTVTDDVICECDCDAWEPFSPVHLTRIVQLNGMPGNPSKIPQPSFPAKQITAWQMTYDYPGWEEASENLGVSISQKEYEQLEKGEIQNTPFFGDKLSGWPAWIQGIEYPACPVCGEAMELVLQLDSEDNLPYMFGDVGCGHITQCPTHGDQLGFGWACG
ncbi:MAG: DUF1963 domain-containing protein, partial [Cyanobacteria bacterium P01_A01_bin.17]